MKIKLEGLDTLGQELADEISDIGDTVASKINQGIKNLAFQAQGQAAKWAATRLYRTRQQYIDSLSVRQVGPGMYAVVLAAEAAHLEEGYTSFDMKPGLLKTGNVHGVNPDQLGDYNKAIGANANGTKGGIRVSKDGYRYRAIPFDHSASVAAPTHPLHDAVVQKGQDTQQTMGSLAADMKQMIKRTRLNGITKDANGNPIIGKVASVTPHGGSRNQVKVRMADGTERVTSLGQSLGGSDIQINPLLSGLTKYQYEERLRNGGTRVRTAYMTFRMVSEKQQGKWIHPGFDGAKVFPDLQQWAESEMVKMIERYLQAG
jgi:hypothetical protein